MKFSINFHFFFFHLFLLFNLKRFSSENLAFFWQNHQIALLFWQNDFLKPCFSKLFSIKFWYFPLTVSYSFQNFSIFTFRLSLKICSEILIWKKLCLEWILHQPHFQHHHPPSPMKVLLVPIVFTYWSVYYVISPIWIRKRNNCLSCSVNFRNKVRNHVIFLWTVSAVRSLSCRLIILISATRSSIFFFFLVNLSVLFLIYV